MPIPRYSPAQTEGTPGAALEQDPRGDWLAIADVRELLDLALELVDGLSAQQAMGDDWYEPGHDRLLAVRSSLGGD